MTWPYYDWYWQKDRRSYNQYLAKMYNTISYFYCTLLFKSNISHISFKINSPEVVLQSAKNLAKFQNR